jgi:hypothetical protein
MTTLFFGQRWDAPLLSGAVRRPTPVGAECYTCTEPIEEGDRGLLRPCVRMGPDGRPAEPKLLPVHTECDLLSIVGHMHEVCSCTGYDTSSRPAALELLRRLNERREADGMGPL